MQLFSSSVRLTMCAAVLVILLGTFYMFANLICWTSVRSCSTSNDCPAQTACLATNGAGQTHCVPRYCGDVKRWFSDAFYEQPRTFGVLLETKAGSFYASADRWVRLHWMSKKK